MAPYQHILLIHALEDYDSPDACFNNCRQALRYAGMSFDVLHAGTSPWPELGNYSAIVVALTEDSKLSRGKAGRLELFVSSGGGLVFARPYWHEALAPLMGLARLDTQPMATPSNDAIVFLRDFLPGIAGLHFRYSDHKYDVTPADAELIAESETGIPVAWARRHRGGRVIVFNTTLLQDKRSHGLLTRAVMRVHAYSIRSIANLGLVHMDDFPAAVSTAPAEPVWGEFSQPMIEFYDRVWLPDMLDLAKRFDFPYTFLIPFNYNHDKTPPFGFQEWEAVTLPGDTVPYGVRAAEKIGTEHELGLHGYNHETFVLENWLDERHMRGALRAAMTRWSFDDLGPLPRTYVPPHNIYDQSCVRALARECPSIQSICGFYDDRLSDGEYREFGAEPWHKDLTCLPRITCGYRLDDDNRFAMVSLLASAGIWSHMLHPDDIVDTPANHPGTDYAKRNADGAGWHNAGPSRTGKGLYSGIMEWLDFARTHYPWLRYLTTTQARTSLLEYLDNRPLVSLGPEAISIEGARSGWYELLVDARSGATPRPAGGLEVQHFSKTDGFESFILKTGATTASLNLGSS